MKTKTFDCVQMKREAQRKLREEYEARKGEFDSYFHFLVATAEESDFVRQMRAKFRRRQR
jgi:hypothetical protein